MVSTPVTAPRSAARAEAFGLIGPLDWRGLGLAAVWLLARLKLPARWMHRFVYRAAGGKFERVGRGTYLLTRSLRLGQGVTIGKGCDIVAESITIEDGVSIGDNVCIRCKSVVLRRKSRIDSNVTIRGVATPRSAFELGAGGWVFSHCYLNPDDGLSIGDRTALGSHCLVFTHSSYLPVTHGYPVRFAPVTIGADVWLPWHAFVLPGAVIGDGATVGAFSMVAGTVPPNSLAVGVPAKVVKDASTYRRRYDASAVRQVATDMLRDAIERWAHSFRTLDVFRQHRRQVHVVSQNQWDLSDGAGTTTVLLIDDDAQFSPTSDGDTLLVSIGRLESPANGTPWIDLQTLQSSGIDGTNRRTKALVDILSQFGLRYDWLPAAAVSARLSIDPPA